MSGEAGLQLKIDSRVNDVFQAKMAARAGASLGICLLFRDTNLVDHLMEDWAQISSSTLANPLKLKDSTFKVKISDELGKINVNYADEETLVNLFEKTNLGINEYGSIIEEKIGRIGSTRLAERILDYIDTDEVPRPLGSEAEGYENLPGKRPRNGPMLDINELLNIPGVTWEMFVASATRPGLSDILTVYGDGLINLNTARREVLESIPGPPGYSEEKRRSYFDALFKSIPMTTLLAYPVFLGSFDKFIPKSYYEKFIVYSTWFKIEATGKYRNVENRIVVLIRRDRYGHCKIERSVEYP
ncbi:MAG: general secretion pathway protein GspK [Candidatus Riflebacteria bacterium]|nr:general secretion pathway protein GspK [Candidatus Riflebacteria bacterium]